MKLQEQQIIKKNKSRCRGVGVHAYVLTYMGGIHMRIATQKKNETLLKNK
jgi:hypothetical protein